MSKAFERLEKVADKFDYKLRKLAEEPIVEQGDNDLVKLLDANFGQKDKNNIASNIANTIEGDLQSLYVNISVNKGKLNIDAKVNGAPNDVAKKQISDAVVPKIGGPVSKIPAANYTGWIKYPK